MTDRRVAWAAMAAALEVGDFGRARWWLQHLRELARAERSLA